MGTGRFLVNIEQSYGGTWLGKTLILAVVNFTKIVQGKS